MNGKETLSLYFHIPFCKRKCDYCHFYVIPDKEPFKEKYMEAIFLEWKLWQPQLEGKKILTVYFGGGTPSLLGPDRVAKILSWLKPNYAETADIEVTLEANPEDVSISLMREYAACGVNRCSIGVQSLDNGLLERLSRQHSAQTAQDAVHTVNEAGIDNISIDLMYDLPGQTLKQWGDTLHTALKLPITHLSLYNLVIEEHTVFFKKREMLKPMIPEEEASAAMYRDAVLQCEDAGLSQYEISAFQKHGFYSKHNVGYWTGRPFLGLGPSAFSYWEGKRFRNIPSLNRYVDALKKGINPVDFEEALPKQQSRRELLAIHLRLVEGVDLSTFEAKNGCLDVETLHALHKVEQQGLLTSANQRIALTHKGRQFYDSVASEII